MKLNDITETKHKELMQLINPLIDFMKENDYTFFLVAGKDGICTRHLMGNYDDLHGIITGLCITQPQVKSILTEIVEDLKPVGKSY